MQKLQELHCNGEVAGATLYFKSSRRYTVMQKKQAQHCNAEVAVVTL
jgi:hypothetical protein